MASYPYVDLGSEIPPIPILPIESWTPGLSGQLGIATQAILDTGSDCTLVPLDILMQVKARAIDRALRIPVCGELVLAVPYAVGLKFDRYEISSCVVLGCVGSAIEDTVILGRDVMRRYRIEFDGVRSVFEVF